LFLCKIRLFSLTFVEVFGIIVAKTTVASATIFIYGVPYVEIYENAEQHQPFSSDIPLQQNIRRGSAERALRLCFSYMPRSRTLPGGACARALHQQKHGGAKSQLP
jgi:hypothetical protein